MPAIVTDEITAIQQAIAEKIGQQKFRVWFKNSTTFTLADGYLKVGVPNLFIGSWIENHYATEIQQAVQAVTGNAAKLVFTIDPELAGRQRKNLLDSQAQLVARADRPTAARTAVKAAAAEPGQKPLKYTLETFVVGPCNQLAYNAAKTIIAESVSPFNPLFIHGGYGLGKTHLLQGICNAFARTRPQDRSIYVSAEDFANQFVLALKTKKLEAFRRRFRQTDLLVIDDIHFLASKPSMQEEFLHTFDKIELAEKQIVLASDAHPKMIGKLSQSLENRFISGMVVKISPPDFQTRCQICRHRAAAMNKDIPLAVIEYVAGHITTNVRELEGALLQLVAVASLGQEKLSLDMAKCALEEHICRTDPIVHISDIESVVTTFFGITPADVHSSRKDRTVSLARSFSMYLARKHTRMSFPEIGRLLGNKNHATVILACRRIEDLLARNADINWLGPAGNRCASAPKVLQQLEESIGR
jgi:chromosomal replication initiator protein